jgi:putative copper resistance protein D
VGGLGYTLDAIGDGWRVDPLLLAALGAAALLYLAGVARRRRPWPVARTASFIAGLAALWVALASGADTHAGDLLSAHMVQHMLLAVVAPPLLVGGAPVTLALGALPAAARRSLARALRGRTLRWATFPPVALALFAAALLGTHVPAVYELALRSPAAHIAEHALYFATALLFWGPLVGNEPLPHRPSPVARVLWLLLAMTPMALIGVTLLTVDSVVYSPYARATRALGGSGVADQHLAGTIMWIGGKLVLVAAVLAIGWAALVREERRQAARDSYAEAVR